MFKRNLIAFKNDSAENLISLLRSGLAAVQLQGNYKYYVYMEEITFGMNEELEIKLVEEQVTTHTSMQSCT